MSEIVNLRGPGFAINAFEAAAADDGRVEYRGTRYVRGPRQALLRVGAEHWRDDGAERCTVTREHLVQMAANARDAAMLIPINYDHLGGAGPSAGRGAGCVMHDTLEVSDDGVLSGLVAYTDEAARQVRAGERPGISAEFALDTYAKDAPSTPIGAVLFGAALLGALEPQQHDLVVVTQFTSARVGTNVLDTGHGRAAAFAAVPNESRTEKAAMDYKTALCKLLKVAPDSTDEVIDAALAKAEAEAAGKAEGGEMAACKPTEQQMSALRRTLGLADGDGIDVAIVRAEKLAAEHKALGEKFAATGTDAQKFRAELDAVKAELKTERCEKALDSLKVVEGDRERGRQAFAAGGIAWDVFRDYAAQKAQAFSASFAGTTGKGDAGAAKANPGEAFAAFRDAKLPDGSFKFGATSQARHDAAVKDQKGAALWAAVETFNARAAEAA